ncbi:MAG: competence/damage-inducible protein A [Anaerolineae bacterium]|nr:competence/damage-inducible protein A [Thermoflexales bacterium]MDW8408983.1 competence/damage-inducible protein A [Anaerolineae bacterium]
MEETFKPIAPPEKRVELFAIGNELLVGQVLDTNTHWLIRSFTALGAHVRRAHIVRDEYDEIADSLSSAMRRAPRLMVTTGGLGPTDDDLTLRAVARLLGLPLIEHPLALEMVRRRYEYLASVRPNFSAELNEARRKMALFPQGAHPLANPSGAAPGMALDLNSQTTLVCLPGVPSEMKDIFNTSLQPILQRTIGAGGYVEHTIVLDRGDESRIAAALHKIQAAHPTVYVKSRGQTFEDGLHLTVVLSHAGSDVQFIRQELSQTEQDAIQALSELGYRVLRVIEN